MDLSKIDLVEAAGNAKTLHLRHPVTRQHLFGDDGEPVSIDLLGAKSREFKAAVNASSRNGGIKTIEELEKNISRQYAAVTVGWNNIGWQDELLKFNRKNAEMLYLNRPWVREQIDEFIADDANFWEESETS